MPYQPGHQVVDGEVLFVHKNGAFDNAPPVNPGVDITKGNPKGKVKYRWTWPLFRTVPISEAAFKAKMHKSLANSKSLPFLGNKLANRMKMTHRLYNLNPRAIDHAVLWDSLNNYNFYHREWHGADWLRRI